MRLTSFALLALGLPAAAGPAPPAADDAAGDAKKIEGTWVVVPATFAGLTLDEGAREEARKLTKFGRFTFRNGKLTMWEAGPSGPGPARPGGGEDSDSFRLDPTKTPKQIDLLGSVRGIYELDGDTLKLCVDIRGEENGRPAKFGFDTDKPTVVYYVLKRAKK